MFDPLDVPGYDVLAPLGGGRSWKALAAADRARVVLRPVHGGEEARRRLRRRAAVWGSLASKHVVGVRDVFSVDPYVQVVVSDYASGGGLDALLARRGHLDDGEIVTLVAPLAETLAAAHLRGLVHGRITAGNIVFGDDGRPSLADAVLAPGDADGAERDVAALVSVAQACLGRRRGAVHDALDAAAASGVSATELAAAVLAAAPARAIALHDPGRCPDPVAVAAAPTRSRRPLFVATTVVVAALVVGVAWGHKADADATDVPQSTALSRALPTPALPTTPAGSVAPATTPRWRGVVQRLEGRRLEAYRDRLRRRGLRAIGLDIRLDGVTLVEAGADRAVVRVVDGWTSYDVIDGDGRVVGHRPAHLHGATTVVLRRTTSGWRLQRVLH